MSNNFTAKAEEKDLYVDLDLQFFADPEDPQGTDPVDPPADPPTDPTGGTNPEDDKGKQDKTFTQADVNAIAAREAKKAQEGFLKKLGVENFDDVKDGMEKFRQWQESQKTDQEKLVGQVDEYKTNYEKAIADNETLNAKIAALSVGIKPESLDDAVILARTMVNDDVSYDEAMARVVEKYPNFKAADQAKEEESKDKPKFSTGEHGKSGKTSEMDKWLEAFK